MIGYGDKTYCTYWKECQYGLECDRALTKEVKKAAKEWWGKRNPPICLFADKPKCFKYESE